MRALLLGWLVTVAVSTYGEPNRFPGDAVIEKNISYVTNAHTRQTLDLYRPAAADGVKSPLVVWMHGGAWKIGDKNWNNVRYLVGHGYALASVDYRLTGDAAFPAQIQDCNAALNFLLDHADYYNFDTNRVVIGGASAGGHLALLLGLARIPEFGARPYRPRAVIDCFGISDLTALAASIADPRIREDQEDAVKRLIGPDPAAARQASPLSYIRGDSPPVLILHGDADPLVPLAQSQDLDKALRAAGVKSELVIIPNAPHDGPAFETPDVQKRVLEFLDEVLSAP